MADHCELPSQAPVITGDASRGAVSSISATSCVISNPSKKNDHSSTNEEEMTAQESLKLARNLRRKMSESQSGRSYCHEKSIPDLPPLRSHPLLPALRPLRHIGHVLILVAGWMLGTVIFYSIEVPAEHQAVAATFTQLHEAFPVIANDLTVSRRTESKAELTERVKKSYIKLLEIEGKWRWSAIQKTEGPNAHYMWTFATSFFFTWTLFTTVGYGSIYPGTDKSRLIAIIFSCFFYPLDTVVVRDLGHLLLEGMTRVYGKILVKIRKVRGHVTPDTETISLPWTITAAIAFAFMFLCAWLFKLYDDAVGPEEGMSYFISFYFTFLSLTMIGLGDIMPTNEPWAPAIGIVIVAGLPLMRVITKMTYSGIERAYFGAFVYIENRLGGKQHDAPKISIKEQDFTTSDNEEDEQEKRIREELESRNFTVRSLASYVCSGEDVYGGEFGRVSLRKSEL